MADEPREFPPTGLYLDDLVATGKPSLGQLQVVSWIVRHFVQDVLKRRAAFHAGEAGASDPLPSIEREARELGAIFLGKDPRFDAQPWNDPKRLGMTFAVLLPEETKHYGDSGTALFMWLAAQTAEAAAALEGGMAEADVRTELDGIVSDVTDRLLGVKY